MLDMRITFNFNMGTQGNIMQNRMKIMEFIQWIYDAEFKQKINIKERGPKFGVKLIKMENVGRRETHWSKKKLYNYLLNKVNLKLLFLIMWD